MCCNKKDLLFVRPLGADEAVAAVTNNWSTGNQPQHKLFSPSECQLYLYKLQNIFHKMQALKK